MAAPAYYFGESIGAASQAKAQAAQQWINAQLANRQFAAQQQSRNDQIAQAQSAAQRQNYILGLNQANARRNQLLNAAKIAVDQQRAQALLSRSQINPILQNENREAAMRARFAHDKELRGIDATARERARMESKAGRDQQILYANLLKDPGRNKNDLLTSMAGLNLDPGRQDTLFRALANKQRKAADFRETAKAAADRMTRLVKESKYKTFPEIVNDTGNWPEAAYVQPNFETKEFEPRTTALAYKIDTDALDYFNKAPVRPPMVESPVPTGYFPPATDSLLESIPEDPFGWDYQDEDER